MGRKGNLIGIVLVACLGRVIHGLLQEGLNSMSDTAIPQACSATGLASDILAL